MLCQFTFKNYKSFKDEVTLDLQPTNISEHVLDDKEKYLPLAAIYGPNGSGKSNLIDALYGLVSKIMRPICAACDIKNCPELQKKKHRILPFKLNSLSLDEPTDFELIFKTKQAEYKYNLSVKDDVIIFESLFMYKLESKRLIKLFTREHNTQIIINKTKFKGISVSNVTDTLPLLSFLRITHKDIDVIQDIFKWLEYGLEIINYSNPYTEARIFIPKTDKIKNTVLQMLKEMDIDIEDYRIEKDNEDSIEIYTKHCANNSEAELTLGEESSGTIKLFGLLPEVAYSILNGSTLVVDELDAKLHPKLLEYIIELYRNLSKNKKGAQLIFTSHDLMTMTPELFRRDEIWFVAKNSEQSSQLYSLVEFKKENGMPPRKDEKYGKQYLEGRYGADPYLRRMINWEELYEENK